MTDAAIQQSIPKITTEQDRLCLFWQGTKPADLTAHAVLTTAERDILVKARNAQIMKWWHQCRMSVRGTWVDELGNERKKDDVPATEKFCFMPEHVGESKDAADLLRIAWNWRNETDEKHRKNAISRAVTAMIYDNADTLRQAYELASVPVRI